MANLFKSPTYKSANGYNGFDMSHLLKFSSTVGELLPVYFDILQPDDKVSLATELRTRTMELQSAAMCKINEYVDWFFVPMTQIYSIFGDWYFGIQDFKSSLFDIGSFPSDGSSKIPFFNGSQLAQLISSIRGTTDYYFNFANTVVNGTEMRLLEMLGYPVEQICYAIDNPVSGQTVNYGSLCPILFCAYQKIYFDHYRISDREPNEATAYNLDKYFSTPSMTLDNYNIRMFTLRYRPWRKDFFTDLKVSPLFNQTLDTNGFPDSNSDYINIANNWLSSTSRSIVRADGLNTGVINSESDSVASQSVANLSPSVASIRTMFAIDKLLEVTRRAGKHVDDQTLAHFGIKPSFGINGEVKFIGSSKSDINIGDVIATSSGNGVSLGEVGGKGYGYGKSEKLKFHAPCHGILMGIYSAVPEVDYYDIGLNKLNTLASRMDWFTPEFDDLGMQPLFNYQCISPSSSGVSNMTTRLGWQFRYAEYKCKYNRVVGALGYERSLKYWSSAKIFGSNILASFLVNPTFLNNFMVRSWTFLSNGNSHTTWFADDPLIHELYFDVQKASRMSTYGLPSL